MTDLVSVVVVNSLSYTGTTWLNVVMGCHERAFTLGPPDRVWKMCRSKKSEGLTACLVHGKSCKFWPAFIRDYDLSRNFFSQLSDASGKDILITNNPVPDGAGSELNSTELYVKQINLIRDGRALLASYMRKFPQISAIDAITGFLYPSFHNFHFDKNNSDVLCLRYEDVLDNKKKHLEVIGRFLGIEYKEDAQRFWEHEHHVTSGNKGTIACIRLGQNIPISDFSTRDFYEKQFEQMKSGDDASFTDDRWRKELSERDLFLFDLICGPDNERFGYERDKFTLADIAKLKAELIDAIEGQTIQGEYIDLIRYRLNSVGTTSPAIEAVYIAPHRPSLRAQLNKKHLMTKGICLLPRHLKLLFKFCAVSLVVALAVLVLLIYLLWG